MISERFIDSALNVVNGGFIYIILNALFIIYINTSLSGSGSSVGLATELLAGRSGDRIPVGGRDFPHLSRPALGPTQPPVQWIPGFSRG